MNAHRIVRSGGTLVVSFFFFSAGGALLVNGLVYFYLSMPGGSPNPARDLAPFNDVLVSVATSPAVASVALLGTAGFVWEVRSNGLLPRDERTLKQKIDDVRRKRAKESHVWSHPDVDAGTDHYRELQSEEGDATPDYPTAEDGDLALIGHQMTTSPRRVRGIIENQSDRSYSNVAVQVVWLIDGEPAGEEVAWKNSLSPDDKWRFEVYDNTGEKPSSYRITDLSGSSAE